MAISRGLHQLGHEVIAVTRGRSAGNLSQLDMLAALDIQIAFQEDLKDVNGLAAVLSGCDVAIVALRANAGLIRDLEPPILEAARQAKVSRFVPDEFGTHTKCLNYGISALFDAKKKFQEQVFASGLEWTLVFPGGIFDYFLPNLRLFEKVTTFGNLHCTFPTHSIEDIGAISARAVTDLRTADKAVQMYANIVTQEELIATLARVWPNSYFEIEHVPTEPIIYLKDHGDPVRVSAKGGAEPDRERHGINYVTYVLGRLGCLDDPDTLNASDLYPDYVYKQPEEVLADPKFVFGESR
jgi:uncharacterized protein YbjT (DUF2867 family)